jgi:16S rRNA (guanine527-N7)-methyltransferase
MSAPAEMQIADPEWNRLIVHGAGLLGVQVSEFQVAQFGVHIRELLLWNRKTNITAIIDPMEAAIKHVVDSLSIAGWIPPEASVLDVGSGGGFPGIPLKILMPSLSVTLVDASRKKNSFQQYIIRTLGLVNIAARQIRVETLANEPDGLQAFSVIVCRAFTDLARFIETALPLLAPSGRLLAMKGRIDDKELDAAVDVVSRQKGDFRSRILSYTLPVIHAERCVYMLESVPLVPTGGPCSLPA